MRFSTSHDPWWTCFHVEEFREPRRPRHVESRGSPRNNLAELARKLISSCNITMAKQIDYDRNENYYATDRRPCPTLPMVLSNRIGTDDSTKSARRHENKEGNSRGRAKADLQFQRRCCGVKTGLPGGRCTYIFDQLSVRGWKSSQAEGITVSL